MGVHFPPVFVLSYARINMINVKFVLLFILSSFHLLANCTNFPFYPHLPQESNQIKSNQIIKITLVSN